jgi:hypothetical protein
MTGKAISTKGAPTDGPEQECPIAPHERDDGEHDRKDLDRNGERESEGRGGGPFFDIARQEQDDQQQQDRRRLSARQTIADERQKC